MTSITAKHSKMFCLLSACAYFHKLTGFNREFRAAVTPGRLCTKQAEFIFTIMP